MELHEIDILICEHVTHQEVVMRGTFPYVKLRPGETSILYLANIIPLNPLPRYTKSIGYAMQALEELRKQGKGLIIKAYPEGRDFAHQWTVSDPDSGAMATASNLEELAYALCVVMLKSLGIEVS